jgi:N-acetylmuramoyl-L-alanine amidase
MIILDCGHGGINPETNRYETAPNKMWHHLDDDYIFYEGEYNRVIAKKLESIIKDWNKNPINQSKQIQYEFVSHPYLDTLLKDRVDKANDIFILHPKAIYLSFHANASPNQNAKGFEVFSGFGSNYSDVIASQYYNEFMKSDYFRRNRFNWRGDWTDADPDKEANFYVLRNTTCPAILIEHGFFDHPTEYKFLLREDTILEFAYMHMNIILWHYNYNNLWNQMIVS